MLVAIALVLLVAASASAAEGEGRFRATGAVELQGVSSATFQDAAVVVSPAAADRIDLEFTAASISVERTWAETVFVPGAGPLQAVSQETGRESEIVDLTAVAAETTAVKGVLVPPTVLAWGGVATLAESDALALHVAVPGNADPYGDDADTGRGWWRPDVPLNDARLLADAETPLTLTGDFTLYLFEVDWVAHAAEGTFEFSTGEVETGPGQGRREVNIVHVVDGTLVFRHGADRVYAPALVSSVAGTVALDAASGYYDEDGTRFEATEIPAVLQGTFDVNVRALDGATDALAFVTLAGDLERASLAPRDLGPRVDAATAGKAAAATTGALVLVAGTVLVARRGRERWVAGHVQDPAQCVEHALRASAEGRPAEALRWYRRARSLAPGDALLALDEGHAADAVGEADAARRAYEEALRLDPDLAEAHLRYARTLALQGLQPAALSHLGRAFALEPSLAREAADDQAFAAWRDHPRFAQLVGVYLK